MTAKVPTTPEEFAEPQSLDEADRRRKQLTLDVQSIQAQLGDRQRCDDEGKRLSNREYWAWKKRAQHALNQRLNELREIKQWIVGRKKDIAQPSQDVHDGTSAEEAVGHLYQLHSMLSNLQGEDVDFDEDEKTQIDAAGVFLRRVVGLREPLKQEQG